MPALATVQTLAGGAKVNGTGTRRFQFEADDQNPGATASCGAWPLLTLPGGRTPAWLQGASGSGSVQLMPSIGMTSSVHGTVSEQPSDWFSSDVRTSNGKVPVPSGLVNA